MVPVSSGNHLFTCKSSVPLVEIVFIGQMNPVSISVINREGKILFVPQCRVINVIINTVTIWCNHVDKVRHSNFHSYRLAVKGILYKEDILASWYFGKHVGVLPVDSVYGVLIRLL